MSRIAQILIGLLALQVAVLAIVKTQKPHVKEAKSFLALDTAQVDFVHIKNEDGEITLERVGGNWKITKPYNYRANPSYAQTLLEKLDGLDMESLITSNQDKLADFELDDSTGIYVEVGASGQPVDKFLCGKPNSNYTHTYMRRASSNDVWLITGTPRSSFTRRPKDWRDKRILDLDKAMFERILLKHPNETVDLTRKIDVPTAEGGVITPTGGDTSWTVTPKRGKPFTAGDKQMNRIINSISKLRAMDFLFEEQGDTIPMFSPPTFSIEVFLEGNQHEEIDFVPQPGEDSRYVARQKGVDGVYFVIYSSTVKNLIKKPDELKPEAEDKPEA